MKSKTKNKTLFVPNIRKQNFLADKDPKKTELKQRLLDARSKARKAKKEEV